MSRAIEHGKALVLEIIEGFQEEIEETGRMEDFGAYLVEQNYVSEDEKDALPRSARRICDSLIASLGWDSLDTADMLMDFGKRNGMVPPDEDELDRGARSTIHDWRRVGF